MSTGSAGFPFGGADASSAKCRHCGWLQPVTTGSCQQCGGELLPQQPPIPLTEPQRAQAVVGHAAVNPYAPPVASGIDRSDAFVGMAYAGVWHRFLARSIDTLVFFFSLIPVFVLMDREPAAALLLGAVAFLAVMVVQCMGIVVRGQSIGKRVFKIRVVTVQGQPVGFVDGILMREVVPTILANLCGVFGLLDALMIFSQDRRCLHDRIAKTIVIEAWSSTQGRAPSLGGSSV